MVYPATNRKLSQKMVNHGGLLTEFGHDSKPDREQSIVDYIRSHKELPIDTLQHLMQSPASELSSTLIQLEFKGMVRPLPGKRYMMQ